MFKRIFNNQQPISLKWKWGILLFVTLTLFGFFSSLIYQQNALNIQLNQIQANHQYFFEAAINYLESMDEPIQRTHFQSVLDEANNNDLNNTHDSTLEFLTYFESNDIVYRFFNEKQQLVYETQHINLNPVEYSDSLKRMDVNNQMALVGSTKIISENTGESVGSFQYIVMPQLFDDIKSQMQNNLYVILIGIILFALAISFLLIRLFLRPLTYLVNSLDLVEAESLSQLRVRKPRSTDEWSDLSDHINRLLDKIDNYVKHQKQFVEDVSHELRTPVAIVEGHLTMLNRWGKEDPEILEESISASLQEITRMKGLVQEMLDLMRADHVDIDYKDEITEVYSTIRQVFNNFVMLYPEFQFYLDIESDPDELYVKVFRNHFEQIFIILLDNAVKYSTDRKEIHVALSTSVTAIRVAVQDFGEGMSAEDKDRVFGRFYRVDKARSRDKGGNGLGLSIAQQLVKSYRGEIWADSVLHHGSIFYVEFPILSDTRQIYKSKQIAKHKSL